MWYFASGDSGFYFAQQFQQLSWLPVPWVADQGFGASVLVRMWVDYPYRLLLKLLFSAGLSWFVIDKVLWLSVFFIGFYSSFKIGRYILQERKSAILASIIYITNTYVLLLFGGGQIGVALAYAFAPFVVYRFIKFSKSNLKEYIINGLCLGLLIAFDLRIAFLIVVATVFWWYRSILSLLVAGAIHLFWILPVLLASGGVSDLGTQFTSSGMLKFLSVADFPHALSLLHPNWPENLFGKVYFLQPEFLVLPLIAFSSLLFVKAGKKTHVLFFALLAILGAFFAKGVREPFGGIFQWMFIHIPGFVTLRDPTKFYVFTAIGYSLLIPYTLERVTKKTIFIVFILFWCFTIRAVFAGRVNGNFHPLTLKQEYVQLKDALLQDMEPSRTLWIPKPDKFAYFSNVHPILSSDQLFQNASVSAVIAMIGSPKFDQVVRQSGVGYVIVPEDLEKNMFLTDYKFDKTIRDHLIRVLDASSLRSLEGYGDLKVYQTDHDPMQVVVPKNVVKQQYWVKIGLIVSILSLATSVGYLVVRRKRS